MVAGTLAYMGSSKDAIGTFAREKRLHQKTAEEVQSIVLEAVAFSPEVARIVEAYISAHATALDEKSLRTKADFIAFLLPLLGSLDARQCLSTKETTFMETWTELLRGEDESSKQNGDEMLSDELDEMPSDDEPLGKEARPCALRVSDFRGKTLKEIVSGKMLGQAVLVKLTHIPRQILTIPNTSVKKFNVQAASPEMGIHFRASYNEVDFLRGLVKEYDQKVVLLNPVDIGVRNAPGATEPEFFAKVSVSTKIEEVEDDVGIFNSLGPVLSEYSQIPTLGDYTSLNLEGIAQSVSQPQSDLCIINMLDEASRLVKVQAWRLPTEIEIGGVYRMLNLEVDLAWKRLSFNSLSDVVLLRHVEKVSENAFELDWPEFVRSKPNAAPATSSKSPYTKPQSPAKKRKN